MARRGPVQSTVKWVENCLGAQVLRCRISDDRWCFLRYEDFAAAPAATTRHVLTTLREPDTVNPVQDGVVRLTPNHTVAGNPDRFRSGDTRIKEDAEWRQRLPERQVRVVTELAAPLLRRYGYPLRPVPAAEVRSPR
jgi:hypothetical protein